MIKGKTAWTAWLEFVEKNHRTPELDEFIEIGYSRATYYVMKRQYKEEEEKKKGE